MQEIVNSLHPLERKIVPYLKSNMTVKELAKKAKLKEVEVMRAVQWLENKKVVEIKVIVERRIKLGSNGLLYLKNKLPERRLLTALAKEPLALSELPLDKSEIGIAIGQLKKLSAVVIGEKLSLSPEGRLITGNKLAEEKFMDTCPLDFDTLTVLNKNIYNNLLKRKELVVLDEIKTRTIKITEIGKKLQKEDLEVELFESLTQEMLKNGSWKQNGFRSYDISVNVPKVHIGKRQPYMQFLNSIKMKLIELGFKEMTGPLIETEFFNFDALFQPQNHPARTWTDTYRLKDPSYGKLPDELLVNRVKHTHEEGGQTKSKGWRYKWDPNIARQLMPRAHGTALSARTMSRRPDPPCRYFAIARTYRPDVLDATHLLEFNQMEGFVIDESINFKTLLGMLRQFAIEVAGAKDVKFFPDYYPFTEPSVQMSALHPELGWVEFGGAGIFRPEVTSPMGIEKPVMAWGLGIDRLAMFKLGISDIRYLFSQDLKWLREPRMI